MGRHLALSLAARREKCAPRGNRGARRVNTASIDRLSDEDAQILRLGRGVIRGHTCKVLVLEPSGGQPAPSLGTIRRHVAARLDAAPRFRKRLINTPLRVANPVWVDDPDFDIANHITGIDTDHPLDRAELTSLTGRLMGQELDPTRPVWHMSVVEQLADGDMAIVWRVHHCLADGTTCMRLASAILWDGMPTGAISGAVWAPSAPPTPWGLLSSGLAERARRRRSRLRSRPSLRSLAATEQVAARELRPSASLTRLAAPIGATRSVAFASLPLEACRRAGKSIAEQCTVNDVVLAVIAGAVRRWLGPDQAIRVKVPVSLHHGEQQATSNHDSYFFVDLPVNEPDPGQRVLAINRETTERKLHHDAETLYHLGSHPAVAHWVMNPHVFTFNVSNVRGPAEDVFVVGARLRELYSMAEVAQHHALRIAVLSAAGSLFFGLCADAQAVPDLAELAEGIDRSGEELLALVA
jgi:diacylglycerol O-acyltransferase